MRRMKLFETLMVALSLTTLVSSCAVMSGREKTEEYLDDTAITTAVKKEILMEDDLKSYEISVKTFKGTVQLSGFVKSDYHRQKASEVVRRIEGVKEVRNSLIVR